MIIGWMIFCYQFVNDFSALLLCKINECTKQLDISNVVNFLSPILVISNF